MKETEENVTMSVSVTMDEFIEFGRIYLNLL